MTVLFINVTHTEGHTLFINTHHIEMVRATLGDEKGESRLFVVGDKHPYPIRESVHQVLSMIPEG